MATATKMGRDLLLSSSPNRAVRAATIKIRFADIIVKAKYRKLIAEGSNEADAMMRIQKEKKQLQREEKARIEARALRLKLRQQERLALEKMEEEARSNIDNHLLAEKEIVNLCGGSFLARTRWVKKFGLVLTTVDDDDDCLEEKACDDDHEEGEIY